jgi:sugar/nucleoside kinase (ribokinase family)
MWPADGRVLHPSLMREYRVRVPIGPWGAASGLVVLPGAVRERARMRTRPVGTRPDYRELDGGDDMTSIVVVGDLMTDTVARAALPLAKGSDTPAAVSMHGGGSGANIAAWLAVDGAEVAFVGRCGTDIAGRAREMELKAYGVDVRLARDPQWPTGACVVMVTHKGDHTMLYDRGANAALSPDDLPQDLFVRGSHLHMSGYTLLNEGSRSAAVAAMERALQADMTISVDGGSAAPLERLGAEPFRDLTGGACLLIVNDAQAAVLTGRDDPERAIGVLTAWYPQVVVKLGSDGAAFGTGRSQVGVPAQPLEKLVDGTGGRDAFCAGFLPTWLAWKPPAKALAGGCRLAARALVQVGGRPALGGV